MIDECWLNFRDIRGGFCTVTQVKFGEALFIAHIAKKSAREIVHAIDIVSRRHKVII